MWGMAGILGYLATRGVLKASEVDLPTKPYHNRRFERDATRSERDLENLTSHADTTVRRYNGKELFLLLDGHVTTCSPGEVMADNKSFFLKREFAINL